MGKKGLFLEGYSCDLNVFSKFWVLRGETLSYYKGKTYDSSTHTNCKNLPDNCKFLPENRKVLPDNYNFLPDDC